MFLPERDSSTRFFASHFFPLIDPIRIPDSYTEFISNSVSNLRRHSNPRVVPWDNDTARNKDRDRDTDRDRDRGMDKEGIGTDMDTDWDWEGIGTWTRTGTGKR